MARPGKPWWWAARGRWAATVAGVRYTAPPALGPRDQHAAWAWHAELLKGQRPRRTGDLDLAALCECYLAWDAERVAAGQRDARAAETMAYRLTRICRTLIGGSKAGAMRAAEIDPGHVEDMMRAWAARKLSAAYVRQLVSDLKAVLRWASRRRGSRAPLLEQDPLAGLGLPAAPESPERFATRSEAATWLRWLRRRGLRDFALLQRCLIYTGARPKELATATWGDIRWRSHRTPAGHWMAVLVLARWKAARATGRLRRVFLPARLCRSLLRRFDAVSDLDGLIWSAPRGGAWSSSNLATFTARQRDAAIAAGLPFKAEGPDRLVNYRWRHTAASQLVMDGVPIATVAELLGTSVKVLARTYAHLLQGHLGDAAERLGRAGKQSGPRGS